MLGTEIISKKTEISVDLNSLLRELKRVELRSFIVVLIAVENIGKDAIMEKPRVCENYRPEIETIDLANFLKTTLS